MEQICSELLAHYVIYGKLKRMMIHKLNNCACLMNLVYISDCHA